MISETELLRRYALNRDEAAFAELVQRHLSLVYNAALRRVNGNRTLAEDAAQIVFTQLACKADHLVEHPALLGWLHTSTRYAAAVLLRRERRLAERHEHAAAMTDDSALLPWDTLRPVLDASLDQLDAGDRQAILLRYFANRSHAEIGAEFRISENAARKRVDRALERLRDQFARQGVTTTAAALATALSAAPAAPVPPAFFATVSANAMANAMVAGAAAGIGSATLAFSTAKVTLVATAAALTALLATGGALWNQQQQRRSQLDVLAAQATEARTRIRHVAEARPGATAPVVGAAAHPPDDVVARANWMKEQYGYALLLRTSPVNAHIREQEHRLKFLHEFGPFLATRNYPPEKVAALRDAMVEYYQNYSAHQTEALLRPELAKSLRSIIEADKNAFAERLKPTFTEDEQTDIRRCFDAQAMRPFATEIARKADFAGVPLDHVQELALAMIMNDAEQAEKGLSAEQRAKVFAPDPVTRLTEWNRRQLDDAKAFLSPEQVQVWEEHMRLNRLRTDLQGRANAQYRKAHPSS